MPAVVRKLMREDGWNSKVGCHKKVVAESPTAPQKTGEPVVTREATDEPEKESHSRIVCETEEIRQLFLEGAVCCFCEKENLTVSFESNCVNSNVKTKCSNARCATVCETASVGTALLSGKTAARKLECAAKILFVLAQMLSGDGGMESSRLLGLLDPPAAASIDKGVF